MNGVIYFRRSISNSFIKKHNLLQSFSFTRSYSSICSITPQRSSLRESLQNCSHFSTSREHSAVLSSVEALNNIQQLLKQKNDMNFLSYDTNLMENLSKNWEGNVSNGSLILQTLSSFSLLSDQQIQLIQPKLLQLLSSLEPQVYPIEELTKAISCLKFCSTKTMHMNRQLLVQLTTLLSHSIEHHSTSDISQMNHLGLALSGLKHMSSDLPEVQHFLQLTATQLKQSLENEEKMTIQTACLALSGLESSSSSVKAVRDIVKILSDQLREPERTGKVLKYLRLKRFQKNPKEVRSLVSSQELLMTGYQMNLAAAGLKGLSSEHVECRALIGSLAGRLQTMRGERNLLNEPLTGSAAVALLSNMKNMDSSHPVVMKFLYRILSHLRCRNSVEPLTPSDISSAISGLKSITSTEPVIVQIIEELQLNRIENTKWTPSNITAALSGLEFKTSKSGEMKRFLSLVDYEFKLLQSLKRKTKKPLHLQGISTSFTLDMVVTCFTGLSSMSSSSHEIQSIVECLNNELEEIFSPDPTTPTPTTPKSLMKRFNSIISIIGCLSNMCSHHSSVRKLLKTLSISIPKPSELQLTEKKHRQWMNNELFAKTIHSLKLMDSNHYEVRQLIRCLTPHFKELFVVQNNNNSSNNSKYQPAITFNSYHIVKMMSGLRGLSNESFTVDPKSNLMGGRGGVHGRGEPICDLLRVCQSAILTCSDQTSLSRLCGSFYGLQSMQSGPYGHAQYSDDLVETIESLIEKRTLYSHDDDEEDEDGSGSEEDNDKNGKDGERVRNFKLTILDCYKGLYGLLDVADYSSQKILAIKLELIQNLINFISKSKLSPEDPLLIEQIYNFYDSRASFLKSIEVNSKMEELNEALLQSNRSSSSSFSSGKALASLSPNSLSLSSNPLVETSPVVHQSFSSELESSFFQDLTQLFGMDLIELQKQSENPLAEIVHTFRQLLSANLSTIKLKHNELLFAYQTDILLRIYSHENPSQQPVLRAVFDIEIDGPSHQPRHKRRFSELRDNYLKKVYLEQFQNILFEVFRISIPDTREDLGKKRRREMLTVQLRGVLDKLEERYGKFQKVPEQIETTAVKERIE